MGLRLRDEDLGLDVKDHGETAYGWQHNHQQQHEVLLNVDGQVIPCICSIISHLPGVRHE